MSGPEIRPAAPDDLAAVTALTSAAYAPWTAQFGAPPLPVTAEYAPRIAAGEVWLLAPSGAPDGLPDGLIVLERHDDHLLIFSLAVAPAQQGSGHGKRLLAFAEQQARAAGMAEIRLYTNARMTRNIALYAACGYRETGRRSNPARPGWTAVDMAKPLTSASHPPGAPPSAVPPPGSPQTAP